MKKKIIIIVAMAMALTTLVGCGKKESEQKKFTVGFDSEFEPYGFVDENGEYVGFDLDLAKEVCKRNDWELVKQPIDWDAKDMELSSGTIDCIWNGFSINGRETKYTWSSPYVNNSQVFVVEKSSEIEDQSGLSGKVLAVQKDSSALSAINDEKNATLKASLSEVLEFNDYNTAFMELEMGTVDAVAMDIGVAKAQMSSRDKEKFIILEDYLAAEQYGVGFLLGNEKLKDQVETTLYDMLKDGTFLKIATKWDLQDSVCLGE
ncbi:MAG TPA: amino acid ABC transporter substrate-binding protein [Lachnospiraceae bacterium]|nr:amino acid ABC transporter substrate-binding protein [Lachnospiraceae bacterium]